MPKRPIQIRPADPSRGIDGIGLQRRFDAIRAEFKVPRGYPVEALAEAEEVAAAPPGLPVRDETSVPFLTIDPPGSMDLDQALHIERAADGYRVRYAIADVPAFVRPGGALDAETRRRGQTIYAPDKRTPLHPPVLSEGAASLLPGQVRPAFVWDLSISSAGEASEAAVYRAMVKSLARFDYDQVQRDIDGGTNDERLRLLKEVGEKRIELERKRGGASLPMPQQQVSEDEQGHYRVDFRPPVPAEDWNAQLSLMTGMAAADMMVKARVGILRTMPPPEQRHVDRFRHQARALGVEWARGQAYGEFLRSLDRTNPKHLALIYEATSLFRGAGYTPFDGEVPDQPMHAAVAAAYAHVTAPLRRLVDRFGLAVCEALSAGQEVPEWVRQGLRQLPEAMATSDRVAGSVDRACADAVEAALLQHRLGQDFDAVAVEQREKGGVLLQVDEPAVVADADGGAQPGTAVRARLTKADVATSSVRFRID